MSNKKQISLAFFIPLSLTLSLLLLRVFVFYNPYDPWITNADGSINVAPYEEYELPQHLIIMAWLIIGLFILTLILPSFVMMRTYQNRRNKLEVPSIFE